jgi:peptidoglycan/LPS O-acetylase OafA/YrhL
MKRSTLVFLIAFLVLLTTVIWFLSGIAGSNQTEFLHLGVIILIVAFAIFVGVKRLKSEKRGEPTEDELSKKVMLRTAALSYYVSLYLWVFLLFLKDRIKFETEQLIGTGILAMAVTFAVSWLYFNFKGVQDA